MRRPFIITLAAVMGLSLFGGTAYAAWRVFTSGTPTGVAKAVTIAAPGTPTVTATGSDVTISWPATTVGSSTAVTYEVQRTDSLGAASSIASCSGNTTSCVDRYVRNGSYSYSVVAKLAKWKSLSSQSVSASVNAALPGVGVSNPSTSPLNSTAWTGGISGFASSQTGVDKVVVSVRNPAGLYWNGTAFVSSTEVANVAMGTTSWSLPIGTSALTDGGYVVKVTVTDKAGNTASTSSSFVYDNTAPTGTFSLPGFIKNGYSLAATASDSTSGIASVKYSYGAVTIGTSISGPSYNVVWTGQPTDGPVNVVATVTDKAGNNTSITASTSIDNNAPVTTDDSATIGSAWSQANKNMTLTPTDTGSGVSATRWALDATATDTSAAGTSIDITTEGTHTVSYFSVDTLGNRESVKTSGSIRIDRTAPTAATVTQGSGNIRTGQVLKASGTDALSGVASVEYFRCTGITCTSVGSSTDEANGFAFAWASMPADGTYQLYARVFDEAGNSLDSAKVNAVVDNTSPTVTLTAPAGGATVTGSAVSLTATAADTGTGVASVQFQYRSGSTWTNVGMADTTSPFASTWDTTSLADGSYGLRAVATDNAGNTTASTEQTVTVANTVFKASSVQLLNGSGVAGRVDQGDRIILKYSGAVNPSSMCSAWGSSSDQSLNGNGEVTVRLNEGGAANDSLTFSALGTTCDLRIGSIDLGSRSYVTTSDVLYRGNGANKSTVTWDESTKTLEITLGSSSGGTPVTVASSNAAYLPDSRIRNTGGAAISTTSVATGAGRQF